MRFAVISAKNCSERFNNEGLLEVKCSLKRRYLSSHGFTSGVLWGRCCLAPPCGHSLVDLPQKFQGLLGPVPQHAVSDQLVRLHIQRGEERGRAVALVIVGHGCKRTFLSGNSCCSRSRAWICDFSSTLRTTV